MARRPSGSAVDFITKRCHIHGHYGDKVYRRKNNGQPWVYDYVYKPKYSPTVLSRRTTQIVRAASKLSNPCRKEYKEILQKIYYFTPYFVYAGSYNFSCNTFLKLRFKGFYELEIEGNRIGMNLTPRTKLNFVFNEGHEYMIKCYQDGKLYSQRQIIVMEAESDLENIYNNWFEEHLAEILNMEMPYFAKKKVYRRGIIPPTWIQYMAGKTEQGILYRSSFRERFMYVRQPYKHNHTTQGNSFYKAQKRITTCWNEAGMEFKQVWAKYHNKWFDATYRKSWKVVRQHNLWSKLIFRAGGILGIDLQELSPENWLPGLAK